MRPHKGRRSRSTGPVSGACFNPAVTISVICAGKMELALGLLYIVVQVFAGVVGSFSFFYLYGKGVPFGPQADTGMELAFSWYQVRARLPCLDSLGMLWQECAETWVLWKPSAFERRVC